MSEALAQMAKRLSVDSEELKRIIKKTVMPSGKNSPVVSDEEFLAFIIVANKYELNPLTKEIYAFPTKGGGIQPIVSIDGWMKLINSHPQFNGMEFHSTYDEDHNVIAIRCCIYRKDREKPISVVEYMTECVRATEPWQKWPVRMLRHKSAIQCARYAFGFSGIIDEDEAQRYQEIGLIKESENNAAKLANKLSEKQMLEEENKKELFNLDEVLEKISNSKDMDGLNEAASLASGLSSEGEKTIARTAYMDKKGGFKADDGTK